MGLVLNIFRARFERPDAALPYIHVSKEQRPKDVFGSLYDPLSATRVVNRGGVCKIVFLRGVAPTGINTGTELYEWTAFPSLAKATLDQSFADALSSRFTIAVEKCDDRPWGFSAFRPTPGQAFVHFVIEEGISLRAIELDRFGDFAFAIEWKSRVRFTKDLSDPVMQKVALGSSVILRSGTGDEELRRFESRYIGHVSENGEDSTTVACKDGVERNIPSQFLLLEPGPSNFAKFDRAFPNLTSPGGLMSSMLRADKALSGNIRNRRVFRDRLEAVVSMLGANGEKTLQIPVCSGGKSSITIAIEPVALKSAASSASLSFLRLQQPRFVYRNNGRITNGKKIDGLIQHGPFRQISNAVPKFGFIFPEAYRDDARRLFVALRDGVGLFRGFPNWFRIPFRNDQVSHISGFEVPTSSSNAQAGQIYKIAVERWLSEQIERPELFFVIHDKTEAYEESTPYHVCKSRLLEAGVMTQNVTVDLLRNRSQFEWSAANIALAAFVKLGGTPWTVDPSSNRNSLIIGIGRSEYHDPISRVRKKYQAFATCISSKGLFGFSSVSPHVESENDLSIQLAETVVESLKEAEKSEVEFDSLIVHLTGDLKAEDRRAIEQAIESYVPTRAPIVCVLGISDRADIFAVSDENEFGIPSRGTCACLSENHFLLFTEGMEDLRSAGRRTPCAVQVRLRYLPGGVDPISLVAQVYDLSQVNFRGFNGTSKPVSVLYSGLIARILRHEDVTTALKTYPHLHSRMWFI